VSDALITLAIRTESLEVEGEVAALAEIAPPGTYVMPTTRWECGPKTFELLVNDLLTPRVADAQQRFTFAARLRNGVWDLLYRDVPIQVGARTPEGRLWPA
jgi:hypothetical protein